MSLEQSRHFHPDSPSPSEKKYPSSWVEINPENFPTLFQQETFGELLYDHHIEALRGRKRPITIFDQPIEYLWNYPKDARKLGGLTTLLQLNFNKVSDVMELKRDFYETGPFVYLDFAIYHEEVEDRLAQYFRRILPVTPQANLLRAIYAQPFQDPVPAKLEPELIQAVEDRLAKMDLPQRERFVLDQRFGLRDGIERSRLITGTAYKAIGGYSINPDGIRYLEKKVFKQIEHRFPDLEGYLGLPEASFGRRELGIMFRKDLPQPGRFIVTLSDSTWRELSRTGITLMDYLAEDYSLYMQDLSQTARDEIETSLLNTLRKEKRKDVLE